MRRVNVEVLEDVSRPDGGYAVIVLHGLTSLPDRATFRLKPVDARGAHDAAAGAAWPAGEHVPVAVRVTEAGVELVIGPEIVESPALLPGTIGVIEIQAALVRGEFLWPSIKAAARPRRRHLASSRPARAAGPGAPAASAGAATGGADEPDPLAALSQSRRAGGDARHEPSPTPARLEPAIAPAQSASSPAAANSDGSTSAEPMRGAGDDAATAAERATAGHAGGASLAAGTAASPRASASWRRSATRRHALIAASVALVAAGGYLFTGSRSDLVGAAPHAPETPLAAAGSEPGRPGHSGSTGGAGSFSAVHAASADAPAEARAPQPGVERRTDAAVEPASTGERTAAAASAPARAPVPASAASEVTLRMRGGGLEVSGELKGYDGTKYLIETRTSGLMTMDASRFECSGEACDRSPAAIVPMSERPSAFKPDQLVIEGTPALGADLIPQLIRDYAASLGATAAEAPGATAPSSRWRITDPRGAELASIDIVPAGTAAALAAVERGTAAIALADRPLGVPGLDETRATPGRARPPALVEHVIGLDGVAVVAGSSGGPVSLSLDVLARTFAGEISDWFELGLPPGPIQLYVPGDASSTAETFARSVLKPRGLELSRAVRRVPGDADAADAVAHDPRGLGLAAFASVRGARPVNLEMQCGLIVRPTPFAIKTGEYPLVRRLSLVSAAQPALPTVRGLVRLAQSGELQPALAAARLADPSISWLPLSEQGERMAWAANAPAASFDMAEMRQMLADLNGASRLSATFRFIGGSNDLDARSRRDIARLAATLKEPAWAGRRVILAGFTDAGGKFHSNLAVGAKRAGQIRTALLAAAGSGLDARLVTAKGYGALAPVACNGTPEGTRLNRRVEVWVSGDAPARSASR